MKNNNNIEEKKEDRNPILSIFTLPVIIGVIAGGLSGYIYYIKVGCLSGTCPLTSNPVMSIIWGSVIGYLAGDMFKKKKK